MPVLKNPCPKGGKHHFQTHMYVGQCHRCFNDLRKSYVQCVHCDTMHCVLCASHRSGCSQQPLHHFKEYQCRNRSNTAVVAETNKSEGWHAPGPLLAQSQPSGASAGEQRMLAKSPRPLQMHSSLTAGATSGSGSSSFSSRSGREPTDLLAGANFSLKDDGKVWIKKCKYVCRLTTLSLGYVSTLIRPV